MDSNTGETTAPETGNNTQDVGKYGIRINVPIPRFHCPVHGVVIETVELLGRDDESITGLRLTDRLCGICYKEWLLRNLPHVKPIADATPDA